MVIFLFYQNIIKKNCLLILDRASSHINQEIIDFLNLNNINYVIIPPGYTRFLQPLDVSINKPLKTAIKEKYLNFLQLHINEITENNFSITDENIINFINEIWNTDDIIRKDIIKNSFLYCGISQVLDGSEDEYFRWPDLVSNNGDKNENFNIINDFEDDEQSKNKGSIILFNNDK